MECIGPKVQDADLWILTRRKCAEFITDENCWKSSSSRHIAPRKRKQEMTLFEKFVTEGKTKERASWQKMEQCWMEVRWRKSGPPQSSRKERRFTRRCSTQLGFTVCEELKPKPTEKWIFVDKNVLAETHYTERPQANVVV